MRPKICKKLIFFTWKSVKFSKNIINWFIKKIIIIQSSKNKQDLYKLKSLNLEKLSNYSKGDYSVRINKQYRIVFNILSANIIKIAEINELSKHYE